MRDFNHVLEQNPQHVQALVGRGKTRIQMDEVELAAKDFEAALHIDPSQPEANRFLGQFEAQKSNQEEQP